MTCHATIAVCHFAGDISPRAGDMSRNNCFYVTSLVIYHPRAGDMSRDNCAIMSRDISCDISRDISRDHFQKG